jgi:hypothetical protein
MALPAPLAIVGLSCLVILLVEVLTLLLVSNSSSFKRLVTDIDRTSKVSECTCRRSAWNGFPSLRHLLAFWYAFRQHRIIEARFITGKGGLAQGPLHTG